MTAELVRLCAHRTAVAVPAWCVECNAWVTTYSRYGGSTHRTITKADEAKAVRLVLEEAIEKCRRALA